MLVFCPGLQFQHSCDCVCTLVFFPSIAVIFCFSKPHLSFLLSSNFMLYFVSFEFLGTSDVQINPFDCPAFWSRALGSWQKPLCPSHSRGLNPATIQNKDQRLRSIPLLNSLPPRRGLFLWKKTTLERCYERKVNVHLMKNTSYYAAT